MNLGVEDLARLGCKRMLIFIVEEDYLTVAAKNYYRKLKMNRWKGTIKLVENEKEDHYFHLLDLDSDKAQEMRHKFVSFLKHDQFNLKQDLAKFVLFDSDKAQEMRHKFVSFLKHDQFNLKQDLAKFVLFDGDKAQEMRLGFLGFFKSRTEPDRNRSV